MTQVQAPVPFGKEWIFTCPQCGFRARIDEDQYRGRVSLDCPECPFHETINLAELAAEAERA